MFTHEEETAFVELEKMCDSGNCDAPPATNKLQLKVNIFFKYSSFSKVIYLNMLVFFHRLLMIKHS